MPEHNNGTTPRRAIVPPHVLWPGLVVLLLGSSVGAMAVTAMLAVSDPSFAIVPEHRENAAAQEAARSAQRASDALGWNAKVEFAGAVTDSFGVRTMRELRVTLHDANGAPVEGAAVTAVVYHPARSAARFDATLEHRGAGVYTGAVRADRTALWEVELDARLGADRFIAREQVWLLNANGPRPTAPTQQR